MIGADVVVPVLPKRQISIKAAKADLDIQRHHLQAGIKALNKA
jgi:hypothetical protein